MSGGSYNYAFQRIDDFADDMLARNPTPERRAFAKHLRKVALAMRAIEWVDSGDSAPGDENAAIRACLEPTAVLEALIDEGYELRKALERELERVNKGKPR